ncbi:MAG: hypothetical protein M5U12_06595, partial [Verrucomicrobia bacterium]|nr:hypothetical protein [Verrucomicrobiota bacterium]
PTGATATATLKPPGERGRARSPASPHRHAHRPPAPGPADGDNLIAGCKHLRDAIAAWLGVDDADAQVAWEYAQIATRGIEGVAVSISL